MKVRDLRYFIAEGVKNILVNGIMSVASVGTVICCLFILGIFTIFSMNLGYFTEQIKAQFTIKAIVDENVKDSELPNILNKITAIKGVDKVVFVSKQQALDEMMRIKEMKDILSGLEKDNPLRSAYYISLKNLDNADALAIQFANIQGIAKVNNNKELMQKIISFTFLVRAICICLLLILFIMTVVIISNTVKIAMFARRKEINIMKFIGATNNYIRGPFMVEGMLIGIIGGVAAYILIIVGYGYVFRAFESNNSLFVHLINVNSIQMFLICLFLIIGVIIGFTGSFISIRKHLQV